MHGEVSGQVTSFTQSLLWFAAFALRHSAQGSKSLTRLTAVTVKSVNNYLTSKITFLYSCLNLLTNHHHRKSI